MKYFLLHHSIEHPDDSLLSVIGNMKRATRHELRNIIRPELRMGKSTARCPFCRIPTCFSTREGFFNHIKSLHLKGFYPQILAERKDIRPVLPDIITSESESESEYEEPRDSSAGETDEEMLVLSKEVFSGNFVGVNKFFWKYEGLHCKMI